jgi:hypothetical protein
MPLTEVVAQRAALENPALGSQPRKNPHWIDGIHATIVAQRQQRRKPYTVALHHNSIACDAQPCVACVML